jgi:hypothetical protein
MSPDDGSPSDEFEVVETVPARKRRDAGAAKRKPGRPRKLRADSEAAGAASSLDGYGDPFKIDLERGWVPLWVSAKDAARHARRRWMVGRWGDPRVKEYLGVVEPEDSKGQPIKYESLTLYLMREADFAQEQANNPARARHRELKQAEFTRARQSAGGKADYTLTTVI